MAKTVNSWQAIGTAKQRHKIKQRIWYLYRSIASRSLVGNENEADPDLQMKIQGNLLKKITENSSSKP